MKKTEALRKLKGIKDAYQILIRENFEFKAKSCISCETKGICCQDEHFVNVHITQIEGIAILEALEKKGKRDEVLIRNSAAVKKYALAESGDTFDQTFSCPLYEKDYGCLIHEDGKPIPCISHACYEKKADLPPSFLQDRAEFKIAELDAGLFSAPAKLLPLPLWLEKLTNL
jgi:hypothetical protein